MVKKPNSRLMNQVFQTKTYEMFKFREDNRQVKNRHVSKLTEKMLSKGWIKGSYVVINEKGEIIDGQHRILAAMKANVPVNYIVERGAGFDEIRGNNQDKKNWALSDHISGFVKDNNPNYIILDEFLKKFPDFRVTEALMFLTNSSNAVERTVFEGGNFIVKNKDVAEKWATQVTSLKGHFPKGYNKSIFVRAVLKLLSKKKEFNFDEFIRKVNLRPSMIHLCGTVEQYGMMIEEIYNYRRRNNEKVNLRFL
jgi:hypothetical protein